MARPAPTAPFPGGGENFSASFDEVFFACVAVDRVAGEGGEVVRGVVGVVALERLVRQVGDDDVVGGRVHRDLGGFAEGRLAGESRRSGKLGGGGGKRRSEEKRQGDGKKADR